jgi:outer membrane receptor protein involved in Fe transport
MPSNPAKTFRIDQNWGASNKFFFSYSSRDQEQFNGTQALPAPLDTNFFKSRFSHYLRFGWDRTISNSLLNHFNVGFNRLYDPSRGDSFTGQDWPQTLGIPNASGVLFPTFTFDANALGIGYQGFSANNFDIAIPNGLIVADSVSWVKARHTFRFGFEWRHSQFSRFNGTNTSPGYEFSNFQTAFKAADPQTGDAFASFLLGQPQNEKAHFASLAPRWNQNYYAAFIQDDFKFRKNLTLNLGLRYDVDTPGTKRTELSQSWTSTPPTQVQTEPRERSFTVPTPPVPRLTIRTLDRVLDLPTRRRNCLAASAIR